MLQVNSRQRLLGGKDLQQYREGIQLRAVVHEEVYHTQSVANHHVVRLQQLEVVQLYILVSVRIFYML